MPKLTKLVKTIDFWKSPKVFVTSKNAKAPWSWGLILASSISSEGSSVRVPVSASSFSRKNVVAATMATLVTRNDQLRDETRPCPPLEDVAPERRRER